MGGVDRIEIRTVTPAFNGGTPPIAVSGPSAIPMSAFDGNFCGEFEFVPCIPQPGTTKRLDPIMEWPMWRLQYRNFGTHETLVGNFLTDVDGTDRAGIRWFELRRTPPATPGPWSVHQQGTHSPDATHRWMGSIAMDGEGNIALGYTASNATSTFPSVWYAGRVADDPLGTLPRGEVELFPGNAAETGCQDLGGGVCLGRWGDYASMNVDPVDDCTFWFTGELAHTDAGRDTRIGAFSLCDTLTVLTDGSGTGTVTSSPPGINCPTDCVEGYNDGEIVTLTAAPAADGSDFSGWSGGGCTGTGSCMVTVDKAKNVTATFTDLENDLTVTTAGSGSGTVTSSPAGISCPAVCVADFATGSTAALTATPAAGSFFAGWSGGGCSGAGACSVLMDQDRSVSAAFEPVGAKSVKLKAKKRVPTGKKVRLKATVAPCDGHEGDLIEFQRKTKKGWRTFANTASDTSCFAKATRKIKKTTRFRAVSPQQDADHGSATSNRVRVRAV